MTDINKNAEIIDRIRHLIQRSGRTQADFGRLIGVDASNMSKFVNGRIPVTDGLLNRIVVNTGVSKAWLQTGEGLPYERNADDLPLLESSTPAHLNRKKGAPVYDVDVTAGLVPLDRVFTNENVIGFLDIPEVDPADSIVRVTGNSMMPRIQHGAYVSLRRVSLSSPIFWGSTYLVVLDDYRLIKVVRKNRQNPDHVILHSYNKDYDDMDVPLKDIRELYKVQAVLNYEII